MKRRLMNYWSLLLATILAIYIVFILQLIFDDSIDYDEPSVRCLVGSLHATENNGGIGNIMFELLGFISIAKQLNRIPIINDPTIIKRLQEIRRYFPNISSHIKQDPLCQNSVLINTPLRYCCRYDHRIIDKLRSKSGVRSMGVRLRYLQSYKYLWELSHAEIFHAVRGSENAVFTAENVLFPKHHPTRTALNICVHIRRGDFTESSMHLPSDELFTDAAMQLLIEKARSEDNRIPQIYVFTDNVQWTKSNVLKPFLQRNNNNSIVAQIARIEKHSPPNAEWEFSKKYCDRVLLTAATSTYGWWLGYLSRGQKVYYSKKYIPPGDRADEFLPVDFWPQHWVPLGIIDGNKAVEL